MPFLRVNQKSISVVVLAFSLVACGSSDKNPPGSVSSTTTSSSVATASSQSSAGGGSSSSVSPCTACTGLVINEAVSSNTQFEDEDGDSEDWIELYNNSNTAISLAGWTLSDDPLEPNKWAFPSVQVNAQDYLIVWASDKDRALAGSPLHANFKISSDGETLYLFDASGTLKHSLDVANLRNGLSVGLSASNLGTVYFDTPTPGFVNSATEYAGVVQSQVDFSDPGGVNSSTLVMLTGAGSGEVIHYTLDGTVPTATSPQYQGAVPVVDDAVVRARVFANHYIPSVTQSRTFLPNQSHDIAVVTLATDPYNFFDNDFGIYVSGDSFQNIAASEGANYTEDWERDIHFSFYEVDGSLGTFFDAGVKIFGGYTRSNAQKSLAIYARKRYGTNKFDYPFFPELDYEKFNHLVLRNSGNDWLNTMLRDRAFTSLMDGSGLDVQAARPVAVYLNGEYWGLHNLREKVNENMLARKHDLDKDDINILEYDGDVVEGSNEGYLELLDYISTASPTSADFYDTVASYMDVANFIAYQTLQIYIANTDWPHNNIKFWNSPETPWRWVLYDTDFGFGLYSTSVSHNSLQYATGTMPTSTTIGGGFGGRGGGFGGNMDNNPVAWSTLLLRTLLQNPRFQNEFINYMADQLNSRFLPENVAAHIRALADTIANEIPKQKSRWGNSLWDWDSKINQLVSFGDSRPIYMWQHLAGYFNLAEPVQLTIANLDTAMGSVKVNSVEVKTAAWSGQYFESVPVTVTALAKAGYTFSHWTGASSSASPSITVSLDVAQTLTPVFVAQ